MNEILITYNENKKEVFKKGITYYEISEKLGFSDAIGVIVNGKVLNLSEKIYTDSKVLFINEINPYGSRMYNAGLKMIFELAIKKIYPSCTINYSYSLPKSIVANLSVMEKCDCNIIKEKMNEIIASNLKFERLIIKNVDALNYYKNNIIKFDNIKNITDQTVILYKLDELINYYYYEMPYSTKNLGNFDLMCLDNNKILIIYPLSKEKVDAKDYILYNQIIDSYKIGQNWLDKMHVPYIKDVNNLIIKKDINNFIKSCELNFNIEINNAAKKIYENKNIKYVMISGPSSSGKTTITKRLGSYLKIYGLDPIVISLDDYYKERVDSPKDENGEYDFECLEATDLDYLNDDIQKLINKKEVNLPRFNFITGCKELSNRKVTLKDNSIILFEGLHAINDNLLTFLTKESKYKIFVSPYIPVCIDEHNYISNNDLRLLRRIIRDFRTRGYDVCSTINSSKKVKKGEEKYIIPLIPSADKIINTALPYEVGILKVYLEPLLFSVDINSEYYIEARRLLSFLKQFFSISSEFVPKDSILREFIGGSEYD